MKKNTSSNWLFPEEYSEVVKSLYYYGLLKFDNNRNLPLKSGGKTDIFINLRDARNNPQALQFITELLSIPLSRRHPPDRFVEIPDSVSCFAGPLAIKTGIPYLTIREKAKEGRAFNANIIGSAKPGERVLLMDDVITDGASKVAAYKTCKQLGLQTEGLIVLVDRQQGWQNKFSDLGIQMPVWSGLTLHDVRRQLIELDIMQRCPAEAEELNPIILALDGKSWDEVLPVIDQLRTTGNILKVNDLLLFEGAKNLIPDLSVYGRVMADFKGHDISNTVYNMCQRLKACPPWAVTVHASGGLEMVKAAQKGLENTNSKVLAVTVLTSINAETCEEIYSRLPMEQVVKLANAVGKYADGFVCSSEEVGTLSQMFPGKEFVVPGVRSEGQEKQDQNRTGTPKYAMDNGATKIVMGRQILGAIDPVAEMSRVLIDELGIRISS